MFFLGRQNRQFHKILIPHPRLSPSFSSLKMFRPPLRNCRKASTYTLADTWQRTASCTNLQLRKKSFKPIQSRCLRNSISIKCTSLTQHQLTPPKRSIPAPPITTQFSSHVWEEYLVTNAAATDALPYGNPRCNPILETDSDADIYTTLV
jgi:hypothetical protein